jgi:hypothetical protein
MTITKSSFETGKLLHTASVNDTAKSNPLFALFLMQCINRHRNNDWGNCCKAVWESNDLALQKNNRIISIYHLPIDLKSIHPDERLWVITEWDRSYTTILFPSEY